MQVITCFQLFYITFGNISLHNNWSMDSRPLFSLFRLFNTVDSKQMVNITFADDWIQAWDLWYLKRLPYQLSHKPLPNFAIFTIGGHSCSFYLRLELRK